MKICKCFHLFYEITQVIIGRFWFAGAIKQTGIKNMNTI